MSLVADVLDRLTGINTVKERLIQQECSASCLTSSAIWLNSRA